MQKYCYTLGVLLLLFSCEKKSNFKFSTYNFNQEAPTVLNLNFPVLTDSTLPAKHINARLKKEAAFQLSPFYIRNDTLTLNGAIHYFNSNFLGFNTDFETSDFIWEASFNGEISYNSPNILSIATQSYVNKGGAHGNTTVSFFNFNAKTGAVLKLDDFIKNIDGFSALVEDYFNRTFNADGLIYYQFKLPKAIGFTANGLVFYYNTQELTDYYEGSPEFMIPFTELNSFLKLK